MWVLLIKDPAATCSTKDAVFTCQWHFTSSPATNETLLYFPCMETFGTSDTIHYIVLSLSDQVQNSWPSPKSQSFSCVTRGSGLYGRGWDDYLRAANQVYDDRI